MSFGLVGTPGSAVSVGCGVVVYYVLQYLVKAAEAFEKAEEDDILTQVKTLLYGLVGNKEMIVCALAFAATVLIVYLVRRMSIKYAWTIAMVVGALSDILIILVGDIMYSTNISIVGLIFGTLLGCLVVKVIQFFVFDLDYSKTEKVQFEDDDYYYYVKAVPKIKASKEKGATPAKREKKTGSEENVRTNAKRGDNGDAPIREARERRVLNGERQQEDNERISERLRNKISGDNTEEVNVKEQSEEVKRAEIERRKEMQRRREQRQLRQAAAERNKAEQIPNRTIEQNENDDLGLSRRMAYQRRKLEERNNQERNGQ